jgi:hypothetical protein
MIKVHTVLAAVILTCFAWHGVTARVLLGGAAGGMPAARKTTSTYVNTTGSTVPAGTPLLMAQAFRRGDTNAVSNCATPRNATTHNPLIWQHDNTATRHVNGDDGSVRHESFGVLTDAAVAAGGFYTIEWVTTGVACPTQTAHQTLATLAAAHDLKLKFTNITNQDLTMRGSGSMTFDLNTAASNTGRDAPAKYATGPVYDGWRIAGAPTYDAASSGRLIGAQLSPTQITQSNWTGITNGSFHVVVNGTAHNVTGINLSATTTLTGVAAAINTALSAASAGATISWIPTDEISHFELFSNSTGTSSSVSLLTAAGSGTDISAQLLMTSGATAYNSTLNAYTVAGAAAGAQDPLLYVICYLDVTTQSDGVTMGKVRTVCGVHNGWLSVAAGTSGRGTGPVGYVNDPQTINYRAALLDGANTIMDMSAPFDATINTAVTPMYIGPQGATGCPQLGISSPLAGTDISTQDCIPSAWIIPASTGTTPWIRGMMHVFSTTGTPPHCYYGAGLHGYVVSNSTPCQYSNGHLYADFPVGTSGGNGYPSTYVAFSDIQGTGQGAIVNPTDQGTGIVTWSSRLAHTKWFSWYTLSSTTQEPWSDGTNVSFSPWQPAFDQGSFTGERLYWEESSIVPPIRLSQSTPNVVYDLLNDGNYYYTPLGRGPLVGGNGPSDRPELDILNQFASQAWLKQDATSWVYARSLTLSGAAYPFADLLNEITGRMPALNNGPAVPPGGGAGGSYGLMGAALQDGTHDFSLAAIAGNLVADNFGVALPLAGAPINLEWGQQGQIFSVNATYGIAWWDVGGGSCCQPNHEPEFEGLTYSVWGAEWALDRVYSHAARVSEIERQQALPNDGGRVYYNIFSGVDDIRGGWWIYRQLSNCAAFGDDTRDEQHWCNDSLVESNLMWLDWVVWLDGSTPHAYESSISSPGLTSGRADTFMSVYGLISAEQDWLRLHDPYASQVLPMFARLFQATCGHSVADFPAYPPAYYCTTYIPQPAIKNGGIPAGGNQGLYPGVQNFGAAYNTTNGQDYGSEELGFTFTPGSGQIRMDLNPPGSNTQLVAGDLVRDYNISYFGAGAIKVDQLDPTRQYVVMAPIDNSAYTFYIQCTSADHTAYPTQCPTAGQAFTSFTIGGAPANTSAYSLLLHSQYDNGYTYNGDYIGWVEEAIGYLAVGGYNMSASIAQALTRFGVVNDTSRPTRQMDPTVVVP